MGFDIYLFVSRESAEKFLCAVCQGVAKDVFETDCGHIFCRTCVGKLIRVNSTNDASATCPHCRANVTWQNVHGSKFLNREISQLQCKCNLCNKWVGDLTKLPDHQYESCPDQFVDCIWKKYGCKETKIKRKDIHKHNQQFKVSHLELKINCLISQHQTQIQSIKKKYEQQINQLNQEKVSIEKKWKQKLINIHKKYSVSTPNNNNNNNNRNDNNSISISHMEHINISTLSTSTINTPHADVQYHSDGSISYDPNGVPSPLNNNNNNNNNNIVVNASNRTRRKRKRSVLDEFGSNSNPINIIENASNSLLNHNNGSKVKRVKKRRKIESNNGNGSLLNQLLTNADRNGNNHNNNHNNSNVTLRRMGRSTVNRKKKVNKTDTPKKKRQVRRVTNDDNESNHSMESSQSASDSDQNMN